MYLMSMRKHKRINVSKKFPRIPLESLPANTALPQPSSPHCVASILRRRRRTEPGRQRDLVLDEASRKFFLSHVAVMMHVLSCHHRFGIRSALVTGSKNSTEHRSTCGNIQ